ncbi:unnamed protein product [Gordionus sp. m RMFG-2023]|uniref:uncharacterized protein LOC135931197 isoform X2 n=1 Tax=Gordionus sp. m RMFG-2023 TaxID=3053472 RepID=UPI0030E0B8EF
MTMEINEIRVIVCEAKNLKGKKKDQCRASVIFGIGNDKFRTSIIDEPSGNIVWNEEQTIKVVNNNSHSSRSMKSQLDGSLKGYKPLIFTVMDKTHVIGKVFVPLAKLTPTLKRYTSQIQLEEKMWSSLEGSEKISEDTLNAHKNAPLLIYEALITKYHINSTKAKDLNHSRHVALNDTKQLPKNLNNDRIDKTKSLKRSSPNEMFRYNDISLMSHKDGSDIPRISHFENDINTDNTSLKEDNKDNPEKNPFNVHNDDSSLATFLNPNNDNQKKSNSLTRVLGQLGSVGGPFASRSPHSFGDFKVDKKKESHRRNYSSSNASTFSVSSSSTTNKESKLAGISSAIAHSSFSNVVKSFFTTGEDRDKDIERDTSISGNISKSGLEDLSDHYFDATKINGNIKDLQECDISKNPIISGVSPMEAAINVETKIIIRGQNLGLYKEDILSVHVCSVECLRSLHYFAPYKISVLLHPDSTCVGVGEILMVTKSGGTSRCLVKFRIYDPSAAQISDENVNAEKNISGCNKLVSKDLENSRNNLSVCGYGGLYYLDLMKQNMTYNDTNQQPTTFSSTFTPINAAHNNVNEQNTSKLENIGPQNNPFNNIINFIRQENKECHYVPAKSIKPTTLDLYSLENCSHDGLIGEIYNLRKHIEDLTMENKLMRYYVDSLVLRVMEVCPEHLEKSRFNPKRQL